jgi:hypothetical protein
VLLCTAGFCWLCALWVCAPNTSPSAALPACTSCGHITTQTGPHRRAGQLDGRVSQMKATQYLRHVCTSTACLYILQAHQVANRPTQTHRSAVGRSCVTNERYSLPKPCVHKLTRHVVTLFTPGITRKHERHAPRPTCCSADSSNHTHDMPPHFEPSLHGCNPAPVNGCEAAPCVHVVHSRHPAQA